MRKIIKPDYYDAFKCLADRCPITCCQEWKISVDDRIYKQWETLELQKPMQKKGLAADYTEKKDGETVIELGKDRKCPFLSFTKLCGLVLAFDETMIPETCRVFPRRMFEYEDRLEYSLIPSCPLVVDFLAKHRRIKYTDNLLTLDNYDLRYQIRNLLLHLTENQNYSIEKSLKMNFYILLDLLERTSDSMAENYIPDQVPEVGKILLKEYGRKEWEALSGEIDRMDGISNGEAADLKTYYHHVLETFEERNELFLDLAENYRKAGLYTEYLEKIAVFAEKYAKHYNSEQLFRDIHLFEEQFLRNQNLFRNYIASEIFANIFRPESEVWEMLVQFEWIAIEYAAIKQAVFLQWCLDGKGRLEYEPVRNIIVMITRMTGYNDDDIMEYLENSFQDVIWDWGYMALIAGPSMHLF